MDNLDKKFNKLKGIIKEMESLAVAYSGGVDSNFLLKVSSDIMCEENILAVTAASESYPTSELEEAKREAANMGVPHKIIKSSELEIKDFRQNPPERCYYCKGELFKEILDIAKKHHLNYVADGANYDDVDDFRPGIKAADELNVRHPLMEAELRKDDIRKLSKKLGLSTWNKPALACLSSRVPYGEKITAEKLNMIQKAEDYIKSFGVGQVRVRHHENTARIEVLKEDFDKLVKPGVREDIVEKFKDIGYTYVSLDMQGFRSGSMNEVLP